MEVSHWSKLQPERIMQLKRSRLLPSDFNTKTARGLRSSSDKELLSTSHSLKSNIVFRARSSIILAARCNML